MKLKPLAALCAAISLLAACETYTEKTSPCFGRSGKPHVTRAASSFAASDDASAIPTKDCGFDALPHLE